MKKNILTSLGPNYEKDDVRLSLKLIFSPERWKGDLATKELEKRFAQLFGNKYKALAVNSGRSALYIILKVLDIGKGDEVIQQSFTCVAVPNSITWNNAKPVYVDVGDDINIDPKDLEKKINKKCKAVIVQHTFGIPADIKKIQKICKNRNLILIEDCAHSLGATYRSNPLGSFGNVSFFSFGRDKALSSVFGGMILTKDEKLFKKLKSLRDDLNYPGQFWVFQQLMHPLLMSVVKPTYNFGFGKMTLGKMILFFSQKLNFLSFPVYESEKKGYKPEIFPAKMPGALAILALNQLSKLNRFVSHRRKIAKIYRNKLSKRRLNFPDKKDGESFLRFPVFIENAENIYKRFRETGILIGNWYSCPVVPCADENVTKYKKGSNKNTEKISRTIINLPTYIGLSRKDAVKISKLLNKWTK
jgi:dTDP-4-amino-4,6-dideoxygalactose transaminase